MHINHQINLASEVWSNFVYQLSHCDSTRREKIDAFFAEIDQNITVRHRTHQIIVESSQLDENAILAALLDDKQHSTKYHLIEVFDIISEDLLDFGEPIIPVHPIASEDRYQHLLATRKAATSVYMTEHIQPGDAAVA